MAKEPNWDKHGVIAAYLLGIPALVIAILAYIRPPDPSHPMSFDFLSKSLVIPPWLAAIVILALIATTSVISRRRLRNSIGAAIEMKIMPNERMLDDSSKDQIEDLKIQLAAAQAQLQNHPSNKPDQISPRTLSLVQAPATVAQKAFLWEPDGKAVHFDWPQGLSIDIDPHEDRGMRGFVLYVLNDNADDIPAYRVEIAEANCWNERHQKFLANRAFQRALVIDGRNLPPMHKASSRWLVRSMPNPPQLVIANDSQLVWPNNDPTTIEIWRLTIAVAWQPKPLAPTAGQTLQGLPTSYLLVRWDRENNSVKLLKMKTAEEW